MSNDRILRPAINPHPFGGQHRIIGVVTELSLPGPFRVRLYERRTGGLLAETWSAANGEFAFNYLQNRASSYVVIAHDDGANPYNAVIADFVTPEPMP